ncbi:hypothetical protein [Kitasatospora sp. GP82]|uniref:hypothetical protein n=1 Tax=Kitasatospora sp. GP82 TaxID=3035089 RepID=UPI002473B61D|nr:hypothetical protein [Kitasatospora sp. GP82]
MTDQPAARRPLHQPASDDAGPDDAGPLLGRRALLAAERLVDAEPVPLRPADRPGRRALGPGVERAATATETPPPR